MKSKAELHELIDQLPDSEIAAAQHVLRGLCAGKPVRWPRQPNYGMRLPAFAIGRRKPERRYEDIRNPELLASLEQSQRDVAEGRVYRFATLEEAFAWLEHGPDPDEGNG